jgi:outer membrane protein assembly factor BamA
MRYEALAFALLLALPAARVAAQPPPAQPTPRTPTQAATPADDQRDVVDLFRQWRKKDAGKSPEAVAKERATGTAFIIVPIVAAKPSSGVSFGLGGTIERPLGSPADTFVSSVLTGASITTKQQYTVFVKPEIYGSGNRWLLAGDNHFKLGGQTTYGLGSDTGAEAGVDTTYRSTRFVDTYLREPVDHLLVGAGLSYQRFSDVKADGEGSLAGTPYEQYSLEKGFDPARQTAAGLLASVRFDSRDTRSDPFRGWFTEARYTANIAGFLGGDSTWQRLYVDVRHYVPIEKARRQVIALWAYGDFVTHGNAPYLSLPATGTDPLERSGRGYAEGRFRGEQLVYGEAEYRLTLRRDGLLGMVAFLNATTVGSTFAGQSLFDSVAIGGGVGFRARLQKRSRTNFCIDIGFGREGSHGFYMGIAEAF